MSDRKPPRFPTFSSPEAEQAATLMRLSQSKFVQIKSAEMSLTLRRD